MGDPFGLPIEVATVSNDSIWIRLNDVMCNTAGIKDYGFHDRPVLFPNPSSGTFKVSLPENDFNVVITDPAGSVLSEKKNCIREVSFSGFKDGIYFVNIFCRDKTYSRKMVVTN
jgi:hypothetical protein